MKGSERIVVSVHPSFFVESKWIDDFVPKDCGFIFKKHLNSRGDRSWHKRGSFTPIYEWLSYFGYAIGAFRRGPDAIVTNFPQLAFAACFWKLYLRKQTKIICWSMNIGPHTITRQLKGKIAGWLLRTADAFVVHSTYEINTYSKWLQIEPTKFRFVPIQRGIPSTHSQSESKEPYIVSMGSAGRDYYSLISAARRTPYHYIIIAKDDALQGIELSGNIEIRNGLSMQDCWNILSNARISIVPLSNMITASGQVTIVASLSYAIPVIATSCVGTTDYLTNEVNGILVPPNDVVALSEAIERVWSNKILRDKLSRQGYATWQKRFSDPVAGRALVEILKDIFKEK